MSLTDYAERELDLLLSDSPGDALMKKCVLDLVKVFSDQGHSGSSAHIALNLFNTVARFKPLTPLTGADDEWNQVTDTCQQNRRISTIFRENGVAYDIDGFVFEDGNGGGYTNVWSRRRITFPYNHRPSITIKVLPGMSAVDALEFAGYRPFGAEPDGA